MFQAHAQQNWGNVTKNWFDDRDSRQECQSKVGTNVLSTRCAGEVAERPKSKDQNSKAVKFIIKGDTELCRKNFGELQCAVAC